jgi:hypothetical protein
MFSVAKLFTQHCSPRSEVMMTRSERKERLGHGALARVARCTLRADGRPYSISYVSQIVNCEITGERNDAIERALITEINTRRTRDGLAPFAPDEVFPPRPAEARPTEAAPQL